MTTVDDHVATANPARILTVAQAEGLAAHLRSQGRDRPAVVISTPTGRAPFIDADTVAARVGGLAEVYVISAGSTAWALTQALPEGCQVYGGASRVYPPGQAWLTAPSLAPMRFAYSRADSARTTRQIVADAIELSVHSHLPDGRYQTPVRTGRRQVAGTVEGVIAGRGMVALDAGGIATVWSELMDPALPVEQVLVKGMRVHGVLDPQQNRLDITDQMVDATALHRYHRGDIILALVNRVRPGAVELALLPRFVVTIAAAQVAPDAPDLTRIFTAGETVTMSIDAHGGTDPSAWALTPIDIDTDLLSPAVALFEGGPAWLVPSAVKPRHNDTTPDHVLDLDVVDVADLARENDQLRRDMADMYELLTQGEAREADLRTTVKSLQTQVTKARDTIADLEITTGRVAQTQFADPTEQFHHEVYVAWAARTSPDDKISNPRKHLILGPDFLATRNTVDGIDNSKIVDVVVDIITDRIHTLAGRRLHQLRSGPGGSDPTVTTAGGAPYWRVSLQHKTPQARRLHYIQHHDGTIELTSIRLHDDFRP